jgi:hypothetical protein
MERRFSMKFLGLMALPMRAVMLGLLTIVAFLADAAELRVEQLAVPYASPWQRATPQQEIEDDALLLEAPDAGLHLAVPRQTRVLKTDAASYYTKLSGNWLALYGSRAKIFWHESAGLKWLACRRPARDNEVSVLHLSTVFAGRAYSVLLFMPNAVEALPKLALDLLAAIHFDAEPMPAAAKPGWIKTRSIYPIANVDVLEVLVQDDVARLGDDGMVSGYGLDFGESSVDWFIEGYQWKTVDARVTRVAWKQGGRLDVQAAADAVAWSLKLTLRDNEADVRASLRVIEFCGSSDRVGVVLDPLQRGAFAQLQRLAAQERDPSCPEMAQPAAPAVLQGERGKTVQADVVVVLPPALDTAQLAALRLAGLARTVVVEIALNAGSQRTGLGGRLLDRARWYVVYEKGEAGLKP